MSDVMTWTPGQDLGRILAYVGSARDRVLVRLTGGAANMERSQTLGIESMYLEAFQGFKGALTIGATQMRSLDVVGQIEYGITELGPLIHRANPSSILLGVVPRFEMINLATGLIRNSSTAARGQFATYIHPDVERIVLINGELVRSGSMWHDEVEFCRRIRRVQVEEAGWTSLIVAFNGGTVTNDELLAEVQQGRRVLLVEGSGGVTDSVLTGELSNAIDVQGSWPTDHLVFKCQRSGRSLRMALEKLGVV